MIQSIRQGIILSLFSVVLTLALLELAARTILPTSDFAYAETTELGMQRIPNQHGRAVMGLGETINTTFSINAQGWSAPYDYTGQPAIAVIGDSFVEAFQVAPGDAFPDLMESELAALGCPDMTTYRFGVSGAPLSSYYVVMQHVLEVYHPRIVVITLVPNDFTESLEGYAPWGPIFWRVKPDTMELVPPEPFPEGAYDRWREQNFALRRFLLFNIDLAALDTQERVEEFHSPPTEQVYAVMEWLMSQMQALTDEHGAVLLFTMEGNPDELYGLSDDPLYAWQAEVEQITADNGMNYLSLRPALIADYAASQQPLHVPSDGHWNERGHRVVAGAVSEWIADIGCD